MEAEGRERSIAKEGRSKGRREGGKIREEISKGRRESERKNQEEEECSVKIEQRTASEGVKIKEEGYESIKERDKLTNGG